MFASEMRIIWLPPNPDPTVEEPVCYVTQTAASPPKPTDVRDQARLL
jgi:hypothetical protein